MSRRIMLAVSLAVLLVLLVLGAAPLQFVGKVVGINDGDPLSVMRAGTAVTVRLSGIDTPERTQAFGTRARQYTSARAYNKVVTVMVKDQDRAGRLVAEGVLPDGQRLNQELALQPQTPEKLR